MKGIAQYFGFGKKVPTVRDIDERIMGVEREQRQQRRDIALISKKKKKLVRDAVDAKKGGETERLRDLYEQARQLQVDLNMVNRDLRRLSQGKIALTVFKRRVHEAERKKKSGSMLDMIKRFESNIPNLIDAGELDYRELERTVQSLLDDEAAATDDPSSDPNFAEFDNLISSLADSEDDDLDIDSLMSEVDQTLKREGGEED